MSTDTTRTAGRRSCRHVERRHVDLLRVSSALCRR
ncbi:putative leader peptide [Janibacter melonis]|nr:putative leader peptide [Janibacter melonis]